MRKELPPIIIKGALACLAVYVFVLLVPYLIAGLALLGAVKLYELRNRDQ